MPQKTKIDATLLRERLFSLFSYDQERGQFFYKEPAGHFHDNGYRYITINKKQYLAHRLVWLYMHGNWPDGLIDHKDGNRDNNRISNLRKATYSQNAANAKLHKHNTSGFKGVCFDIRKKKWQATITVRNKQLHLGRYKTKDEARAAYMAAAKLYQGEFAHDGERPLSETNVVKLRGTA